jgi:phosphoribosylanthranilate isomerase
VPDKLPGRIVLSGGLTAGNVGEGIRRLRPWAVDVSSGVEAAPGTKDAARIAQFIAAVREADSSLQDTN